MEYPVGMLTKGHDFVALISIAVAIYKIFGLFPDWLHLVRFSNLIYLFTYLLWLGGTSQTPVKKSYSIIYFCILRMPITIFFFLIYL